MEWDLFTFLKSLFLFQRSRIQVWLYEQVNMRIEGCIIVSTQAIFPQVVIKKDISEDGQ
jgi:hypothetical protein